MSSWTLKLFVVRNKIKTSVQYHVNTDPQWVMASVVFALSGHKIAGPRRAQVLRAGSELPPHQQRSLGEHCKLPQRDLGHTLIFVQFLACYDFHQWRTKHRMSPRLQSHLTYSNHASCISAPTRVGSLRVKSLLCMQVDAVLQCCILLSRVSTLTRDIDRPIGILSVRPYVCLSVCPSVTFRYWMKMA